jgi:16S rRNA (uracil1498-N3)-methyltransferase
MVDFRRPVNLRPPGAAFSRPALRPLSGATLAAVNLVLLLPDELDAQGRIRLGGRRAAHLRSVLRLTRGARVRVGVLRGPTGTGEVVAIADEQVELVVALDEQVPAPPPIDLVVALPRPKAVSRLLQTVATLGVMRIDLVNAWRVEKSYFSSPRVQPAAMRRDLWLGCEQGAITYLPEVTVHRLLMPYLSDVLGPRLAAEPSAHKLTAHPRAAALLEGVIPRGTRSRIVAAIGPEGGFIERELDSFTELCFKPVSIAAPVLRVETAVAALLAQLALLRRMP